MKSLYTLPLILLSFFSFSQTFDNTFKPVITAPALVYATALQTDGKLIVAGNFKFSGGTVSSNIIRLNADGTLDGTFNTGTGINGIVNEIVIQSDGKILVGGNFTTFNGTTKTSLVRLNSNGTLDSTFGNIAFTTSVGVHGLALDANGKILVRGYFTKINNEDHLGIVRLNTDGTVDNTFNASFVTPGATSTLGKEPMYVQADGKILCAGKFTTVNGATRNYVARLNSDGTTDSSFDPGTGFDNEVHSMAVQSDGKIVLCGKFTSFNATAVNRITRLNSNGSRDTSFPVNLSFNNGNWIDKVALQTDGKILVGGSFQTPATRLLRLTTAGAIDGTFSVGTGPSGFSANSVTSISVAPSRIYLGGDFILYNGALRNGLAAVTTAGALETGIDHKLGVSGTVYAAHVQPDGKIVVGGDFTYINGVTTNRIARLNTNGSLDGTFVTGTGCNDFVYSINSQSDGKLLIGGIFSSYNGTAVNQLMRVNTNGSIDAGFTFSLTRAFTSGGVYQIHTYADDKVLIAGTFTKINGVDYTNLARINSNGTTDATFQNNASFSTQGFRDLAVKGDGTIIVSGFHRPDLTLLNGSGVINAGFDAKTKITNSPAAVMFTADGKVLLGGSFATYSGLSVDNVLKVDLTANLDPAFNFVLPTAPNVSELKSINSKLLVAYSDFGGPTEALTVINEQGRVYSNSVSLVGNVQDIATSGGNVFVTGTLRTANSEAVTGIVKLIVPSAPSAALNLQATTEQGKITLNWTDNSSNEIGFEIFRKKASESFVSIGTTATNVASYIDLTTIPETQYTYMVKASNLGGDSPSSNEVTVTTLPDKPAGPSNLILAEVSPIEISLTWQDNSLNETEMVVYRVAPGEGSFSLLAKLPANTTAYNDSLLKPGKTYQYKVHASNTLGESVNGAFKTLTLSDPTLGSWSNKNAATGVQRTSSVAFVIGGKAYVGTGRNASGRLKDFWEYNPDTDSWTQKADFPGTARVGAVGFSVNGKGYIGTGNDGTLVDGIVAFKRDFYQYDPATNTWAAVADYPEDFTSEAGVSSAISFVIGNYAYVGLGNNGVNNPKDFYRYDPATNQWTKLADFAGTGRTGAVSFASSSKGYVGLGGVDAKYKDVWEYNPTANSWTKLSTDFTSTARAGAVAFVVNNRAYIGTGDAGTLFTEDNKVDFAELNLDSKTWRAIPNFTGAARSSGVAFAIGNNAYVGLGSSGSTYYDDVKSYLTGITLLPPKPINLVAELITSEVKLTWADQATDEVAFVIERSVNGTSNFAKVATVSSNITTYTDNTVQSGNTYFYRMYTFNLNGYSDYSDQVSIATVPPPAAPTLLVYTAGTNGTQRTIQITWKDNASNEQGYDVYRSTDGINFSKLSVAPGTLYTDTGLLPDSKFYYKVRAYNIGGTSTYSNTVEAYTTPSVPTQLRMGTNTTTTVEIAWNDNSTTETAVIIYRSPGLPVEVAGNVTSYVDATVSPNTTYTYTVRAKNVSGTSELSGSLQTSTLPAAPVGLQLKRIQEDVQLTWTSIPNSTYRVYRSVRDPQNNNILEDYTLLAEGLTNATYTDVELDLLIYYYKVQAINIGGASAMSEEKSINIFLVSDVPEISGNTDFQIYPNPTFDKLVIENTQRGQTALILNSQGNEVQRYVLDGSTRELNVSTLPAGMYILKMIYGNRVAQWKFLKK